MKVQTVTFRGNKDGVAISRTMPIILTDEDAIQWATDQFADVNKIYVEAVVDGKVVATAGTKGEMVKDIDATIDAAMHGGITPRTRNLIFCVKAAQLGVEKVGTKTLPHPEVWMATCTMVDGVPVYNEGKDISIHFSNSFIQLSKG